LSDKNVLHLWLQFKADKRAVVGLVLIGLMVLIAILAPYISPQNPYDLMSLDIMDARLAPGQLSSDLLHHYWLGTDAQGRDILSAIFYGLRISLLVGVITTVCALMIGLVVGLCAGYFGGKVDSFCMRLADIQLAFPSILIAMILLALFGSGVDKIIIALVASQWAYYARTARSAVIAERDKEYIQAGILMGLSTPRLMFIHVLPNCLPALFVISGLQIASAITLEATLSFLGLGLPATEPSLGLLIANGFQYMYSGKYWISLFPGVALLLLVVAINLVADQLREILNPQLN
jgi:peptide/nickel transport system permease protein